MTMLMNASNFISSTPGFDTSSFVQAPAPGAMVYFRGEGDTEHADLEAAADAVGFNKDKLPSLPTAKVALHRAADAQKDKRRLVRPLADRNGWAIVDEMVDDNGVPKGYAELSKLCVMVDDLGQLVCNPHDDPRVPDIEKAFEEAKKRHIARDINSWLITYIRSRFHATALNDGHYFVPESYLEELKKLKKLMAAAKSNKVNIIRAMSDEDAIESILEAVQIEATREIEKIEKELDIAMGPVPDVLPEGEPKPIGAKALATRVGYATKIAEKLEVFAGTLGKRLPEVSERLAKLQANLTIAILASETNTP